MAEHKSKPDADRAAQIVAQFSFLVHSWRTNRFDDAARAKAELADLGVSVKFGPPRNPDHAEAAK